VVMNLNQLYGGIDIGLKDFQFHAMDQNGNPIGKPKRFPNNKPGMNQLVDDLDELIKQRAFSALSLGMEATGLYWFPLYHALREDERIQQWNTKLIAMNPKIVESFRSIYPDVDKTDAVDALIIADRVRFGRGIAPQHIHSEQYLALQRLTRFYIHLTKQQTDLKNYAGSFLFLTFSEWIRCKPFSDRYGATATKLMKKYKSADAMADLTIDELQELLVTFSGNHFSDPEQKANDLLQMAEDSFAVPAELIDSIHLLIKQTLQQLELLEKHLNRLKKRIEKIMKGIKHPLLSIPGISHITAALLIAEIGDITRFGNHEAKLAKFAGLTWRKRESGNFRAEETFMTKSGNVYLRHAFLMAAQSLVNHNDEYQAYYRRKFDETPRHAHKRALSLTARKLVRLIHAMLSTNQLYMTPEERMERNQEVKPETNADESAESHLVADETSIDQVHTSSDLENQEHKKVKRTVAARSSSRQKELNGFNVPPEQSAVNT
jgi:transposase